MAVFCFVVACLLLRFAVMLAAFTLLTCALYGFYCWVRHLVWRRIEKLDDLNRQPMRRVIRYGKER